MKRAKLVAVRVAHIGEVHRAKRAVAQSWRVFARRATVRDRHIVKLLHLLRGIALKADSTAVGGARRFAIDRLGHAECSAIMAIEQPRMPGRTDVVDRLTLEAE